MRRPPAKVTREHRRAAFLMRATFAPERITETDIERAAQNTGWSAEHLRQKVAERLGE